MKKPRLEEIQPEIVFTASRSGGPGGQHVNKVSTKITLRWNVMSSNNITEEQKGRILSRLKSRVNQEGELIVTAQEFKSQARNKEVAMAKLEQLLANAFTEKRKRKATKPTKASVKKRLENKKKHSEKKRSRRGDF